MILIRFENDRRETGYGCLSQIPSDGRVETVEPIEGDVFGEFRRSGRTEAVRKLLAPIRPPNVFAIGLNYADHAAESGTVPPGEPLVFLKATTAVVAPGDAIVLPASAPDEVDYEAELVVVIGKQAKNVSLDRAREVILGYTCGNDVSARDCQARRDKQWTRAKSFDTFCPLGPWIVTADELDPSDLPIRSVLNGEVVQDSRTSNMIFSTVKLVSFLSHQFTLLPGTVILTGTPAGVGMAHDPPKFLRDGDEIVIEIDPIGRLRNPVTRIV